VACLSAVLELKSFIHLKEKLFQLNLVNYAGVIVLGGSRGVHDEDQWPWLKQEKELLRNVIKSQTPNT
jgi:GMP synthase-like glutamine amidotransferase